MPDGPGRPGFPLGPRSPGSPGIPRGAKKIISFFWFCMQTLFSQ